MGRGTILKTKIQFKKTKIDLNFDLCTGTDKIKEHCNEQRRLVQLSTENKMQELNKINECLLAEIDEFEMKCNQSYSAKDDKEKIDRILNEANTFLNEKKEYLKQIQLNKEEIACFNKLAENLQLDLNKERKSLMRKIFGKKLIKFDSNVNLIDSKTIGIIEYEKLDEPSVI